MTVCRLNLDRGEDYGKIGYGMFSFIIALNVLEHIKDDRFALQELYRMLQKDGMLVVPSRVISSCITLLMLMSDTIEGTLKKSFTQENQHDSFLCRTHFLFQHVTRISRWCKSTAIFGEEPRI